MKYIIVRMNGTSGPWVVERETSDTKYSIAIISRRRWNTKESAQKAANKANKREAGK